MSAELGETPSVLLLSGRPAFLDPLSQAFDAAGLMVAVARDLAAAAEPLCAEGVTPVGIIIDLIAIHDDPTDICDALRATPSAASIPVLFLGTGEEAVRSTTDALIAGGDGYFQLPVEASRVTAKILAYTGTPTPDLPQGLLVTAAEEEALLPSSEPPRIAPALTPEQLLGEDGDDEVDDRLDLALSEPKTDTGDPVNDPASVHDNSDERLRSAVEEAVQTGTFDPFATGNTPPEGISRRAFDDLVKIGSDEDFADTTVQTKRVAAVTLPGAHAEEQAREREALEREALERAALEQALAEEQEKLAEQKRELERQRAQQEQERAAEEAERRARITALEQEIAATRKELDATRADAHTLQREHEERAEQLKAEQQAAAEILAKLQHDADSEHERLFEEQQKLAAVIRERDARQAELHALEQQREHDTQTQRAAAAELEVARLRLEEELETIHVEHARKERAAQEAIDVLAEQHRAHQAAYAEQERALKDALNEERVELDKLEQERARLAFDATLAERALRELEQKADERSRALRAEEDALRRAAEQEAARIARLRAEEEAARASLDDARARARLAFHSGRFDSLPPGVHAAGSDVGSSTRPVTDDDGVPLDGPLIDVPTRGQLVELPQSPPPPFVGLEPPEGRFDDGELPAVLLAAWSQKVTGAITIIDTNGAARTIYVEDGEPTGFASELASDRAEEALLKGGFVTAAVYATLRAGERLSARRMCGQLVDDGVLKLDELFTAVRGVLTEQLLRVCEWQSGGFTYSEERVHAADRVRLEHGFDAVIAEAVRRKYDEPRLWSVLGGPATLLGRTSDDGARALPPLSAEERTALERFDGTRSLDDVVLSAGLHAHVVLRAAVIGVCAGALRVLARGLPRREDDAELLARRERDTAIDKARVTDKLAIARHGDYFTLLGVDLTATPFEVTRAAARLRERFDPARYGPTFAELRPALQEITDTVNDAESVLGDPQLRDAYRHNLRSQVVRAPTKSAENTGRALRVG